MKQKVNVKFIETILFILYPLQYNSEVRHGIVNVCRKMKTHLFPLFCIRIFFVILNCKINKSKTIHLVDKN